MLERAEDSRQVAPHILLDNLPGAAHNQEHKLAAGHMQGAEHSLQGAEHSLQEAGRIQLAVLGNIPVEVDARSYGCGNRSKEGVADTG